MLKKPSPSRTAGLFADSAPDSKPAAPAYRANIDGASRGNPGPAAYGVVIRDSRGQTVAKLKKYIGRTTNNVAEYYGLIAALDYAQSHNIHALRIESDSDLLVQQMRGRYKVKSPELRPLFERAKKMSQGLVSFGIEHVYRSQNSEADALGNEALDETARPLTENSTADRKESSARVSSKANAEEASAVRGKRAAKNARRKLRAHFRNGAFHPDSPLDLPDGAEVEILVRPLKT